jgi:hypothetical protein
MANRTGRKIYDEGEWLDRKHVVHVDMKATCTTSSIWQRHCAAAATLSFGQPRNGFNSPRSSRRHVRRS